MTTGHTHTSPRPFYTNEDVGLWEIEVDNPLRELRVIAAGPAFQDEPTGIRIRDTYYCDAEPKAAERGAVYLSATEARRLADALLAAATDYDTYSSERN